MGKTGQVAASSLPSQDPNAKRDAMSSMTVCIAYDGEGLRDGATPNSMNVRDLAPALIAFADMFEECNKVLHGNEAPPVNVKIIPDFQPGSFEVYLNIAQGPIRDLLMWFSDGQPAGLANLFDILLGITTTGTSTAIGVFAAIKWIKGRRVQKTELLSDGNMQIVVEGENLIVRRDVATVLSDARVRQAIMNTLLPLRRDDIDTFEIRLEPKKKRKVPLPPIEIVRKSELLMFEPPPPVPVAPSQVVQNTYVQSFTIISPVFKDGNKWQVSDGTNSIKVTIDDPEFMERVNSREINFAKEDIIICSVQQEQTSSPDGLKTTYSIKKVLEHKRIPRQVVLPFPIDRK